MILLSSFSSFELEDNESGVLNCLQGNMDCAEIQTCYLSSANSNYSTIASIEIRCNVLNCIVLTNQARLMKSCRFRLYTHLDDDQHVLQPSLLFRGESMDTAH